jgi:hypothetical protein
VAVRAVIDTNVWVSSLINPFGLPAILRKSFAEETFTVVISSQMIEELAEVLSRPQIQTKYEITSADIKELIILLEVRADVVAVSEDVNVCRDKDDNLVIETAIKGKAAYLVTGDDDIKLDKEVSLFLARYDVSVISVASFLDLMRKA